jgi:hypothetical protein
MHIFYRPFYTSEATQFLEQLKRDRPQLDAAQREGRELLWDQPVDREALRAYREAQVAQQPYVYQTSGHK